MRLARLGSFHQTRLSFLRVLLRRLHDEDWRFARPRFDIDARGVGVAVYSATGRERTYSLVAFSHDLPAEKRTDRVIAEAWDATFALFDGVPTEADIARLAANVPRQEAGRYLASELVLARANRSVRLFDSVVAALADGRQPDAAAVEATGYLMRTTAVYGNGKFGIADRDIIAGRPELAGPYQAEMLAVWLIRAFTADLVEHLAAAAAPGRAVRLDPALRRRLGIGNATGLGMAPFLVRHPVLINNWIAARETALARVRALSLATTEAVETFRQALAQAIAGLDHWSTEDPVQAPRIVALREDLARLAQHVEDGAFRLPMPWEAVNRWAEANLSFEGQELTVSLLMEPHSAVIDDLAERMSADEAAQFRIDGAMSCGALAGLIGRDWTWALGIDFAAPAENARFWYVSEEKLEPRLGARFEEPGADKEQPLTVARDVAALGADLAAAAPSASLAAFLAAHPGHRHTVRRVQILARHPYAEVRDNLIAAEFRAIDMLRCKLSFFGVTRYDPRSDKWLRITLFQGAPFPDEMATAYRDGWIWGDSRSTP